MLKSKNVTAKSGKEIGLIRTGKLRTGTNYITSAGKAGTEPGGPALFHNKLKNNYYIREITHSHKTGAGASKGDVDSHRQISRIYSNNYKNAIRYKVYVSTLDMYILTK